jgi:S1-C subfamily serine protease
MPEPRIVATSAVRRRSLVTALFYRIEGSRWARSGPTTVRMTDRRPIVTLVGACLLLDALGASAYALVALRARDAEVAALRREVAAVRAHVGSLEQGSTALAGRVRTTERTLRRRETGIAPLATRVLRSVFTVETDTSIGSGFAAWRDGGATYLVTAYHVIEEEGGGYVTVARKGGSWSGEISAVDPEHDLAVIRVSARPANAEPLWQTPRATAPRTGAELLLVGSPFGLEGTVTTGVVSRVTKTYIQTDAAANPGNSGGPALDKEGHVVGVLVSGGGENINFAIPIRHVCAKLRAC